MSDPLLGTVIAGKYEVLRLIGRGGMGAIYEVRHLRLKRTFAVKVLASNLVENAEALARFQREADVVARLRHPNVVEITDWETLEDGSPCMIMEFLRGEDLASRLRSGGPVSWPLLARIADQILSALIVAHRAGIVHRDLKPQNIFLAEDDAGGWHAKLLDFGVSKIRDSKTFQTADDRVMGTPGYMSPEQAEARGDQVGSATDVWAMGAILFEMAAGRPAFTGNSSITILYRICHGEPEALDRADAPAGFVELVKSTLSRDPQRRIVDAVDLRQRLRETLTPVAGRAFPDSMPHEFRPSQTPNAVAPAPPTTLGHSASEVAGAAPAPRRSWVVAASFGVMAVLVLGVVSLRRPAPISAPPAASTPPTSAPAVRNVTLQFMVNPQGPQYHIQVNGVTLATPRVEVPASRDRPLEVRVVAEGYQPFSAMTVPISDMVVPITMQKLDASKERARPEPHLPYRREPKTVLSPVPPAPAESPAPRVKRVTDL